MKTIKTNNHLIYRFTWDAIDSNAYMMLDNDSALVIDPIDDESFYRFFASNNVKSASVLLTHEHYDHICGLNRLREIVPCTVYASEWCSNNIQDSKRNLSRYAERMLNLRENGAPPVRIREFVCKQADEVFSQSYSFSWAGHVITMYAAPGHSQGSSLITLDEDLLFTGDSLLPIPVELRLPGGSEGDFNEITLPLLKKLQTRRRILPGHGECSEQSLL